MLPSPSDLILVTIFNDPRDLEIARLLGWYRIPLRSAPKVIAVDYLAFYQTAAFKDHKWQIQFIAPVRGHELTTRLALLRDEPDHPHANHEYFKIQIGPLESLPRPVRSGNWKRISFLYTTGEYLLSAETLTDLVVRTQERSRLWKALRERVSRSQDYAQSADSLPDPELDPEILAALLGFQSLLSGETTK